MTVDANYKDLRAELRALREEIRVLKRGALPSLGSGQTVLQNNERLYFSSTTGLSQGGYIVMTVGNDMVVGSFADAETMLLQTRDSGSTQREIAIITDETYTCPKLTGQDGLIIGNTGTSSLLSIYSTGDVAIDSAGNTKLTGLPTSDPATLYALWNEFGTVRMSNGTATNNFCFASIHNHDTLTAQNIATGTTYTKLTNFTDNGDALNCTPAAASDKITITKTGYYQVAGSFNFFCGTNNVTWRISPFLNGVEQEEIHFMRKIGTASDIGSASFVGIIDVTSVPVDLDVRARHDNGSTTSITVEYANLTIHKISPT